MRATNLRDATESVSYAEALRRGLGRRRGLFFPDAIPVLRDVDALWSMTPHERATTVLHAWLRDEIEREALHGIVERAFPFGAPLVPVADGTHALELFHGPTLAFKDFGARFMAQCLAHFWAGTRVTILTATSGDTGAAVAHAFHGVPGIDVVVLYPEGRISRLQEKLFCTLGGNVTTVAVDAPFDDCQTLVKQAFDDEGLRGRLGLNSANSINLARLFAQIVYYVEAAAALPPDARTQAVYAVPSGNFGDLTAGLFAKAMGVPMGRFLAATNANDTVPRYLVDRVWSPRPTVATLSNAMDVSEPSNWPRVEAILRRTGWPAETITGFRLDDDGTRAAMRALRDAGYGFAEPHTAIAHAALRALAPAQPGVFLCTAHPAKFQETVEDVLDAPVELPEPLAARQHLDVLSLRIPNEFTALRAILEGLPDAS